MILTKQKKAVVLGSSGMLGYALNAYYKKNGYQVISIDRKTFDAEKDSVETLKHKIHGANFIVNAIGIIKPRVASTNPEQMLLVNGLFPRNLAKLALQEKVPCFHITTDCVYSGSKGQYNEDDYFDIDDMYGLSKNAGENSDCMTLRTSIIGEEQNNKYSLLEWAKSQKGKEVSGFTNHLWNGVTTIYLAEIIERIYLNNLYQKGIYHIHSPEIVSKFELLNMINQIYRFNLSIKKTLAPNSIDRSLSSTYSLSRELVKKSLKQQISEMHKFFGNHE